MDHPIDVAEFGDRRAIKHRQKTVSLRDLSMRLPPAKSKETMTHIKLGTFSGEPTAKGSYRHNAAHVTVSGVEGDYDQGTMSPQDAVAALANAGLAALVYTTPSHQQDGKGHRWRVLCPLSTDTTPGERADLLARVNGVLGGVLGDESFTPSQSFNYGRIKGNPDPEVHLVDGRFLDQCADLDAAAIGKPTADRGEPGIAQDLSHDTFRVDKAKGMLESAAERLADTDVARNEVLCREAYLLGGLLANNLLDRESILDALLPAMAESGFTDDHAGGDESEVTRIIVAQLVAGAKHPLDPFSQMEFDDEPEESTFSQEIYDLLGDPPKPAFLESASCLAGVAIPPREWMVSDLIPHRTVTILGGDGGTGKSLVALQLAISSAARTDWLGQNVERPGPVVYISAEDERDELHRRMADVTQEAGLQFTDLSDLNFRSLAGENAILADLDRRTGKMQATALFKMLDKNVKAIKPTLVVLDTLADLHSGDQNDQSHARQFITLLRGLCVRHGCTVLLLAHPSLTGINSGTGTGGSMAWGNSVRSRLYLRRVKEDGTEADPDLRILETMKSNYGKIGGQVTLRWQDGAFHAVSAEDESEMQATAEHVFLVLLDQATEIGQKVSPHTGQNYAPAMFEAEAKAKGVSKTALIAAMRTLIKDDMIAVDTVGPPSKRRSVLVKSHGGFTDD
ncbi:AAA family ATPase [Sulfitobacter sp. MF3-043]|uniref:AAA family ATPase n=1 Tax=Sulfitobacter sediminivivens TaxID=3252902 RepID=UPI0036D7F54C